MITNRNASCGVERAHLPHPPISKHLIAATPEGEAATDAYLPLLDAVLQQAIFSTLTKDEIDTLTELLSRISEAANSAANPTTRP